MKRTHILTALSLAVAAGVMLTFAVLGPVGPILARGGSGMPFTVVEIRDADRAGGLQPGDQILALNGYRLVGCVPQIHSPLYPARDGRPVSVTYERAGAIQTTAITMLPPDTVLLPFLLVIVIVCLSFVCTGLYIILAPPFSRERLLLGVTGTLAGLIILAAATFTGFRAPALGIYQIGLPLWTILAVLTHSRWPVDRSRAPLNRVLLALSMALAAVLVPLEIAADPAFGCLGPGLTTLRRLFWVGVGLLAFSGVLIPLVAALRAAPSAIDRTRLRILLWAVTTGIGVPVFTSMIPAVLALPPLLEPGYMLAVAVVIPLAYLYVVGDAAPLMMEHRLSRAVFVLFFLVAWMIIATFFLWLAERFLPVLSPGSSALLMSAPAIFFATVGRGTLMQGVDRVLYGHSYRAGEAMRDLLSGLTTCTTPGQIAAYLVEALPNWMACWSALFYLANGDGTLHLLAASGLSDAPATFPSGEISIPEDSDSPVFSLDYDGGRWLVVPMFIRARAEGVLLFGPRINNRPYGPADHDLLADLAQVIAYNLAAYRLLNARIRTESEFSQMLLAHEEVLREAIAADLHDKVITPLSFVRLQVELDHDPTEIESGIRSVIHEVRAINSRGLTTLRAGETMLSGLRDFISQRTLVGGYIALDVDDEDRWGSLPHDVQDAVFYAVREAVTNAIKAGADHVSVALAIAEKKGIIRVSDDGPGFSKPPEDLMARPGRGLNVMMARMARIGGALDIHSGDRGTVVTFTLNMES